jgi:predicted signal transduction protein with EAL and GGDEF domain
MFIISSPVFIAFVITIKLIVCLFCAVKLRLFSAQDAAD